jgi:hypothetical protein
MFRPLTALDLVSSFPTLVLHGETAASSIRPHSWSLPCKFNFCVGALSVKIDILKLIKQDYAVLNESLEVLTSDEEPIFKKLECLNFLLVSLELQMVRDQGVFNFLMDISDLKEVAMRGFQKSRLMGSMIKAFKQLLPISDWSEDIEIHSNVLSELAWHYIREVESELLPSAQNHFPNSDLQKLGNIYLQKQEAGFAGLLD